MFCSFTKGGLVATTLKPRSQPATFKSSSGGVSRESLTNTFGATFESETFFDAR